MSELMTIPAHEPRYQKVIQDNIIRMLGRPSIQLIPPNTAKAMLAAAVTDSFKVNNSRGSDISEEKEREKIVELAELLYRDLMEFHRTRSVEEICYAIRLGCREVYGEYHGLSVKTYLFFVKSYFTSNARGCALAENHKRLKESRDVKPAPTPEQLRVSSAKTFLIVYERFQKTGQVEDWGNVTYDFLDSLGLVPFTSEEKKAMYQVAEKKVISEMLKSGGRNLSDMVRLKDALKAIHDGLAHDYPVKAASVKAEAKRIALGRMLHNPERIVEAINEILL